jgi:glutathione synthase/RimK-type ligase-like ATP-grasp enzyme
MEAAGVRVVNTPDGIRHCARTYLTEAFRAGGIPIAESRCLRSAEAATTAWTAADCPAWLKRGDLHAVQADDVVYVATPEEAQARMADFARRGVDRVVYSRHLHGDLVKFYGVAGTDFFYHFYPRRTGHSKFGLEQHNDPTADYPFSLPALRTTCHAAARLLGLTVYGGDAIIAPDGSFRLIDFNDWPSFAPCRDAAAEAIAGVILTQL